MSSIRIIIYIILIVATTFEVSAQSDSVPLMFQRITTEQGLPHNYVRAVVQDKKGFMWFGTNYGLARFDGYDFKIFLPDQKKKYAISQKSIDNLFIDSKNNLWLSFSNGGISKMDLKTEKFTYYKQDIGEKYLIGNYASNFHEDKDSDIWVGATNGLFLLDKKKDKFIYILPEKEFPSENCKIATFLSDAIGNIWFVKENRIWILNKKTRKISSFANFTNSPSYSNTLFSNIYSQEGYKIWITSPNSGLLCVDVSTKKITKYLENKLNLETIFIDRLGTIYIFPNSPEIEFYVCTKENLPQKTFQTFPPIGIKKFDITFSIIDDKYGNIYIKSPNGLAKFNYKTGIEHIEANPFISNSISDNHLERIYIDRTDNLWLLPHRKGLNKADLWQKPFRTYSSTINSLADLLMDKSISSVFEDSKGYIWAGYSNGYVDIYDKKGKKNYHFRINGLSAILNMYENSNGDIYLGTTSLVKVKKPDLSRLNTAKELNLTESTNLNIGNVRKIAADNSTNLWLAASVGIYQYNCLDNSYTNHSLNDSLNKISDFYRTIFVDKNQIIWGGSNSGGLTRYNKESKKFKHYLNDKQNNKSISSNTVYSIYEDENQNLWIGTRQGLDKFNKKTEEFEHKGMADELFRRSIFSIIPDKSGNLWFSSDIGVIKYEKKTDKCSFFGKSDGLANNEFSTTASYGNKFGEIFYGGMTGLLTFYPEAFKSNPILAKPVITNFRIFNKVISPGDSLNGREILKNQVWETNKVSLYYYENDFTIEFSALHFSAPENIKYQYKLEGLNNDWINTDYKRRYASYTGLPPGDYIFVLQATNNDGLLCNKNDEVRFYITIIPPFWQTWWFKLSGILLIIVVAVAFYRIRVNALKAQKYILEHKVKIRTQELQKTNIELKESQEEIMQQAEELQSLANTLSVQNDKLIELDKFKETMTGTIVHDLKNPLNSIIVLSELMTPAMENPDDVMNLKIMNQSGKQMLHLVMNILDVQKFESAKMKLELIPTVLNDIIDSAINQVPLLLEGKNICVEKDFSPETVVNADNNLMVRVFTNLLTNAIKFSNKNSKIKIAEQKATEANQVIITLTDFGCGIVAEKIPTIFEKFNQAEARNSGKTQSTGLGLSFCKMAVEAHQGKIWVESVAGESTTFYILLTKV